MGMEFGGGNYANRRKKIPDISADRSATGVTWKLWPSRQGVCWYRISSESTAHIRTAEPGCGTSADCGHRTVRVDHKTIRRSGCTTGPGVGAWIGNSLLPYAGSPWLPDGRRALLTYGSRALRNDSVSGCPCCRIIRRRHDRSVDTWTYRWRSGSDCRSAR
jgi:hypothetical protein